MSWYCIEKWGQRIYVSTLLWRYSPFFGERILYKINVTRSVFEQTG